MRSNWKSIKLLSIINVMQLIWLPVSCCYLYSDIYYIYWTWIWSKYHSFPVPVSENETGKFYFFLPNFETEILFSKKYSRKPETFLGKTETIFGKPGKPLSLSLSVSLSPSLSVCLSLSVSHSHITLTENSIKKPFHLVLICLCNHTHTNKS